MVNKSAWQDLIGELAEKYVTLVAVSKTKPVSDIQTLYDAGQRDFGENYVQELTEKHTQLPADIRWHYIGHLQTNKVKFIAAFVHLIHAVDSLKLLQEISRQGEKHGRVVDVLLQMHIADEETKFGLDEKEIISLLDHYEAQKDKMTHVRICGLMGMSTNTEDEEKVRSEFFRLHNFFVFLKDTNFFNKAYFAICSMGMTADYKIAIEQGSTMVRIGSMLFGSR